MDSRVYADFKNLIDWSTSTYHHLPWRHKRDFYRTLISELMLQQTTVEAVIPRFINFLERYPSWDDLRKISFEELMHEWRGLGYYQRVRSLFQLISQYHTLIELECDLTQLRKQPGIGPYTQGALLSIGLNLPYPAWDANLKRIFSRYCENENEATDLYETLLNTFSPRALNEALMDLGRTSCKARLMRCSNCPLQHSCRSAHLSDTTIVKPIKKERPIIRLIRFIAKNMNGDILGQVRRPEQWLSGYIEIPTFVAIDSPTETHQYPSEHANGLTILQLKNKSRYLGESTHSITKYTLKSSIYLVDDIDLLCGIDEFFEFYTADRLWSSHALKIFKSMDLHSEVLSLL
ncbi:MAG: hypothetical protein FJ161_02775 [Gammaproteobacteria bacterium]|nr:hypothetical protein [Gammaproteobacteria bacterium]